MSKFGIFVTILLGLTISLQAQINRPAIPFASKSLTKEFFDAAMVYPDDARENNISGKVELLVEIDKNGFPKNYQVLKSISTSIDNEAIRLASKLLWHPAQQNGIVHSDQQKLTIRFNLKAYQRLVKERGYDKIKAFTPEYDSSGKIFTFAALDFMPLPLLPDSTQSLAAYVHQQISYPEAAALSGITGTVGLDFIIENDGIVSNIRISKSVGGGCDQEAIRILQTIRWKPGIINQKSVRTHSFIDITFQLENLKQQAIPNRNATGL